VSLFAGSWGSCCELAWELHVLMCMCMCVCVCVSRVCVCGRERERKSASLWVLHAWLNHEC
jgi:hypothetical protein